MTVAFKSPNGMEGESFGILHWDGGQWVEESVSLDNGYVKTTTSNTGTFALVVIYPDRLKIALYYEKECAIFNRGYYIRPV